MLTCVVIQSTTTISIKENGDDEEKTEDETVTTPPAHRKTSILDTLRPRSKSDAYATYKQRKSSFLTQLKMKKSKNVSLMNFYMNFLLDIDVQASNLNQRPLSPLLDTSNDIVNNNLKQGDVVCSDIVDSIEEEESVTDRSGQSHKKSPDPGEFRARAASYGQQARANVSQIVARFRNRSNTSSEDKDRKKYRVVGHVSAVLC